MQRYVRVAFVILTIAVLANYNDKLKLIGQTLDTRADVVPIIDVHTHTSFDEKTGRRTRRTEAAFFEEWRSAGVVCAGAHTSGSGGGFYPLKNRNVIYDNAVRVFKFPPRP